MINTTTTKNQLCNYGSKVGSHVTRTMNMLTFIQKMPAYYEIKNAHENKTHLITNFSVKTGSKTSVNKVITIV